MNALHGGRGQLPHNRATHMARINNAAHAHLWGQIGLSTFAPGKGNIGPVARIFGLGHQKAEQGVACARTNAHRIHAVQAHHIGIAD